MLTSGLVLYLPGLSSRVGDRPTTKAVHLAVAVAWMTAIALISVGGDRRALRRTRQEIEHFRPDDAQWLKGRRTPQGRFNAGQKSHAIIQSALAALFVLSGVLLWLGERSVAFRFPGTVALHDAATFLAIALVSGHLFLALVWPATRPALRGIVHGGVRADWAARHHRAWTPDASAPSAAAVGPGRALLCGGLLVAGALATVLLVQDSLDGGDPTAPGPTATAAAQPAFKPGADTLASEARQALQSGQLPEAVTLLQQAVRQAPRRAGLRVTLGYSLAQSGDLAAAEAQLERAVALAPRDADAHLFLGAVRLSAGRQAAGCREVRRALHLAPHSANAPLARQLLHR